LPSMNSEETEGQGHSGIYPPGTQEPGGVGFLRENAGREERQKNRKSTLWNLAKYLLLRTAGISITIIIGVFITVLIANREIIFNFRIGDQVMTSRGRQIDNSVAREAFSLVRQEMPSTAQMRNMTQDQILDIQQELYIKSAEKLGVFLPFLPRHLLWTWRALRLDLGKNVRDLGYTGAIYGSPRAVDIILSAFPKTLLLVGTAFLFIFLLGIPLSLYLFRHHGNWLDRLFTLLAPISSIPSWVLGMILVLIFAVGLHFLPPGGMLDPVHSQLNWSTLPILLQHMVLPVLAIFLSLFFQLLYTWKTFFLIYSNEDYVELARAKGLPNKELEKQYILRPALNYIITNFALMLVGFWQITIALEYIFDWPGIGQLFIKSLPNLVKYANTDASPPYYGVIPIVVEIVVLFAYLLGITMLVLDVVYALVDPRIRIGSEQPTVQGKVAKRRKIPRKDKRRYEQNFPQRTKATKYFATVNGPEKKVSISDRLKSFASVFKFLKPFFRELRRYPTAIFGLAVITLLVIGSIVAVTAFPYYRLGSLWYETELTGKPYIPRIAKPAWINWFLKDPLPPSIFIDSSKGQAQRTIGPDKAGAVEHTVLTYPIHFPYGGFPSDLTLYFTTRYRTKRPFVSLTWLTPDGRSLVLDNLSPSADITYSFIHDLSAEKLLPGFPYWQNWFSLETFNATPAFELMFADPASKTAQVLQGTYTLQMDVFTYEENSSVEAELVLLGQTWGVAGTDYLRRNLVVPLLWGMPFALALGLVGASLTTFLSMILAGAGAFFGGWLDQLIQRMIEGIMILPVIAIGVILFIYSNMSIWVFLAAIALLNVFGSPTKSFRAALLQIKDSPYIEWARASGAGNWRIIVQYFLPNILPLLVPQLVALIPTYVFLEATLGIFGVKSEYPTWGRIIYDALQHGAIFGSSYWVFEPIFLLLLAGLSFSMLGFALEKILNPRLRNI
jgi:peptide/nickel transport system permease protein